MSPSFLTVKQKLANGFVIFTAIWSSVIMPVVPAYAKMLDNKELPSLGSDQILNEDNTERLAAEHTKTIGTFLSQKKTMKDLSEMAQDYARNKVASEATKEIEHWLSKTGNVKLNIDIDKKFSIKNSQFDWLIPWYDQAEFLLFTQHSLHRYDERFHTNNGIGLRHFHEKSTIGMNAFIDHDFSHAHTRAGLGIEYWQDYLKLNANSYFGLSAWKSASELNHDFNAKPAHGWDIQVEGWLPTYPHLGGNLKYEQYYGDSVALFGKTKRQKNPNAATIGANWTPFPLFTLNASHKLGSEKRSETQAKLQFTWTFGKSLAHHLDPTKVAETRRLSGNRYDFVERNNNIILNYQKKTLLHLSLPTKIQGVTGQSVPLVKSFTGKYPLKHIEWQAPELLAAGGSISSADQTATLTLPSYKTTNTAKDAQRINRYRLRATAYDIKGNASPVTETLIEITHAGAVSISPHDMKFHGKGLANGNDVNGLTAIVRDSLGNPVTNAKVVFVLPNTLTLASQNIKTAINSSVQNNLRKKMQAMKVAKPWEYVTTTNDKGEAQVQFTSQIAGSYEISAYTGNHQPAKAQVVFKPDSAQAQIYSFTATRSGAVADGIATNSVKARITDKNKNPIANQEVTFSATHAKIIDKATTDENGIVEVTLTSLKAGPSEVTLSINGQSETTAVEFLSGKLHQVTILDVPEVYAGRENQVSFQLLDSHGNPIIDAKNDITIIIDKKTESAAIWDTDIDKGIYAAKISGQQSGEHTIQVIIGKTVSPEQKFNTRGSNTVKPVAADGSGPSGTLGVIADIEIDINPDRTDFKSGDNPLVMVTLKDSFGNEIDGIDPKNIHLAHFKGQDLAWRQDGQYDYIVNLPLTKIGDIDITATVNNISSPKTVLTVSHNSGISNIQNVVITPTNNTPNAGEQPTLTVVLTDKSGNPVNDVKQLEVTIAGAKHTLPATQNPDGSYTVTLPAQHSGKQDILVTVNGKDSNKATLAIQAPKPMPTNTKGNVGEQGGLATVKLDSGTLANLKSGDALVLTVTVQDSFKNPLTGLSAAITLAHQQAGTVTWKDNQDGTYTASLPLTKLGADTLTATVNKLSSKAITFNVTNLTGHAGVQNVVITPTNNTPNAGDKPTLTVVLTDKSGNPVNDVKQLEVTIAGAKHILPATQNPDGSYTVTLPAQHSGKQDIQITVNGKDSNKEILTVQAPKPTAANTKGNAGEQGVLATVKLDSGILTSLKSGDALTLTVTATDTFKNPLTGLASAITLAHAQAGTVTWKDNQNGTYTASLPLTKLGNDTLTATANKVSSKAITFNVANLTGHAGVQNVVITPANNTPNAGEIPTLTVKLTDKSGNVVNDVKQLDVTIAGTKHTLPATQNPDGSYTVTLPAQHSGKQDILVTVNGKDSNKATLAVQAPKTIAANTKGSAGEQGVLATVALSSGTLTNLKSGDTLALTVTVQDSFKNPLTGLASAITLAHQQAGTVTWKDNQDGTYTASLPLTKLGADTLTATINKVSSKAITFNVANLAGHTGVQNVVITPANNTPNAGEQPTLTVVLTDKSGNPVNDVKQLEVTIAGAKHTLPATQNSDGSYTVTLPAQHSGKQDILVTVNGKDSNKVAITVQAPKTITANTKGSAGEQGVLATVKLDSGILTSLKSGDALDLTVTATDTFKNPLTGLASAITLAHAQAGTVTWKDNQDGTYTASLPLTKLGNDTLTATANKVDSKPITFDVANLAGHTGVQNVVITPTNNTPNAGEQPTLTVKLTDSHGNPVKDIKQLDVTIAGTKHTLPATQNPDGSYTVTLPAQHSGKQDILVTVNGKDSNKEILTVQAPKPTAANTKGNAGEQGVLATVKLDSGILTSLKSGDTLDLTVTATDTFKNPLTGLASAITLAHAQAGTVTWKDNQNGTYSGTLALSKLGNDTLTATVNTVSSKAITVNVANLTGHAGVQNVVITPTNKSPNAGEIPTLTVKLTDKSGNPVKDIKQLEVTIAGTKHTLPATQNSDGSYTVTLPAQHSGKQDILVTVNGKDSNKVAITVQAPKTIAANTKGSAGEQGVLATVKLDSGILTSLKSGDALDLTVTATDTFKNPLTGLASAITLAHAQAGTVTWKDNQDGTYTASLPLTKLGNDTLTATANKVSSKAITFNVANLTGHAGVQNVVITPTNNTPNAGDKPTLTVKLTDSHGNPVKDIKQLDVTIAGTKHTLPATQNPDGSYTVTLPAQHSGKQDILVTVNGKDSNKEILTVQAPKPMPTNTKGNVGEQGVLATVKLDSGVLTSLKSGDTLDLTVTATDTFKNPLTGLASAITLAHAQTGTVTWKDNQDGTYSGVLALSKLGNDTLTSTVNKLSSKAISFTVELQQDKASVTAVKLHALHPLISAGQSTTLTITLRDKHNNGVVKIPSSDIKLEDNKLALSNIQWKEQGNGVYTTEILFQLLGNHKLISTVGITNSHPIDVDVTALKGAIHVHHVNLDATPKQFVVGEKIQLKLTLLDQFNNGVMDVLDTNININDDNTRSSLKGLQWQYQQNGVYLAETTVTKGGIHSLKATINSKQDNVLIHAISSVGQKQVSDVQLSTSTAKIVAGTPSTLILTLKDQHGNPVSQVNSADIELIDSSGSTISATWLEMNNLGIYNTQISLNSVGSHTVTVKVNNISHNVSLQVTSPQGASSVAKLEISPITAVDAGHTALITFIMKDKYGNRVNNVLNRDIALEIDGVIQSIQLTEIGYTGQYSGQLPAQQKGQHAIKVTVNGQPASANWTINNPIPIPLSTFDKSGQRGALEKVTLNSSKKMVGSGDKVTFTLKLMDKFDNPLTGASSHLKLLTNLSETSQWQSHNDGSYSIELLMNRLGSQAVQAIVKNVLSNEVTLDIKPLSGASNVNTTALTIKDATIEAGNTTELTLRLKDSVDNGVTNIQNQDIHLTQSNTKIDKQWSSTIDGIYTTQVQIKQVGVYPLRATVNQQNSRIETIEVTAPVGNTKVAKAKLASSIVTLEAGQNVELTLELKDQYDNLIIGVNGSDIMLKDSHTTETIDNNRVAWRMDSAGIYKASLPLTLIGKHKLSAVINKQQASTTEMTVNALKGAANVKQVMLTTGKNTVSVGEKTELTLEVQDRFGNEVDDVLVSDIDLANTDSQIKTSVKWVKVPSTLGKYVTDVQFEKVKSHTLIANVNRQTKTLQINVQPLKGYSNVAAIALQVPAKAEVAEKTKLSLILTDKFNNGVVGVEAKHIELLIGSTPQTVIWVDNQNGSYHTELALNQAGANPLTVKVNKFTDTKSVHVDSPSGKDKVASIQLGASDTQVLPNTPTMLTLTLKDKYGNGVKNVLSTDISLSNNYSPENLASPSWTEDGKQSGIYTASVNLKKVAEHTLTVKVSNIDKAMKITVRPFTETQHVNNIELAIDNNKIALGGKVNFILSTKDIYGNNVMIKAADIHLQNANGTLDQPTWQEKGAEYKGELTFSISGNYVITANVGTQSSAPINLTVQTGKPVFSIGNSRLYADRYDLDENSSTNITVTLELKDANGAAIKGKKPHILATAGKINSTMTERADGIYTASFNNPTISKSSISVDNNSIDYSGPTQAVNIVTYGKSEIKTLKSAHAFSINDGFPNTGFIGAQFQITVPIGKPTDYDWEVDIDWLSINKEGIVTMLRKPTPIKNGNAMTPIFKGVPKANTGYKRAVHYRFTLKKWYSYEGQFNVQAAINICPTPSRLIKRDDLLTTGVPMSILRKVGGRLFHEWGGRDPHKQLGATDLVLLADMQTSSQVTQILHPYTYDLASATSTGFLASVVCVEDLK
ncbi:inverse autotransporter beta domain-containing protein [Providencia alcalifaciens]|uniref:invasin domain 3-containing protein n=1 Tax=Providencia alcalifaciens TaxID=126385 RepID=UPI001CE215CA|nr:invasin domain 3-containing protein [Providencia alcalifaciens]UBX50823.1 inverse autotransporter beta domain-containing protein [Providencia alcalifaciens]